MRRVLTAILLCAVCLSPVAAEQPKEAAAREKAATAILEWVVAWNTYTGGNDRGWWTAEDHMALRMRYEIKRMRKGDADPEVAYLQTRIEQDRRIFGLKTTELRLTPAEIYLDHLHLRLEGQLNYLNTLRQRLAKDHDIIAGMKADPANAEKIGLSLTQEEWSSIIFQNQRKLMTFYWGYVKLKISFWLLEGVRALEEVR